MHIVKLRTILSKAFLAHVKAGYTLEQLQSEYAIGITAKDMAIATAINISDFTFPSRYSNCYLFIKNEGCPTDTIAIGKGAFDGRLFDETFTNVMKTIMSEL